MNFFKINQKRKGYLSIFKKTRINTSKSFLVSNFGLTIGSQNLFKFLTTYEILKQLKNTKGDIIEFGVWNGNNIILIKKMIDYLKIDKKIFGFDWFEGLKNFSKYDKKINKKKYIGNKKIIMNLIKFFKLKKIFLIQDDVKNFNSHFDKKKKFCLIYMDLDLYQPTINLLKDIDKNISKNGMIVFDQANKKEWPGEKKALNEFYKLHKNKYKLIKLNAKFSPDTILKRIS